MAFEKVYHCCLLPPVIESPVYITHLLILPPQMYVVNVQSFEVSDINTVDWEERSLEKVQ